MRLTDEQAAELARWRRDAGLRPAERDRVEMGASSVAGWPVGRFEAHLGYHAETVRRLFRRFPADGWAALRHEPAGPGPDAARRALLTQERTWTTGQLAEALAERGIVLSTRHLRRYLRGIDAGWYRTKRRVHHRQDPAKAAVAGAELAVFANRPKRAR